MGPINPYHPTEKCMCRECYWKRAVPRMQEMKKSWPEPEWDWDDLEKQDRASRKKTL